ncbi:cob(I)yrinic acid a,c-diamide adenosyltransferase [Guptibacillus algicola]|uniref:cob(I)yrinic acid a,c-diamide adenosyltransferase n=1 Tax=Guptibacillus algicola TaxID=225844 RepID=UPI001CD4F428|nr:cob(I)yrinic acid a,c-diamide adenosyltransferase [Alkalihalobacillus algicola]MCA0989398.1 cob(I)yrinic acid a,c-diamide adenosyltransferase [Alkalihalobacillus algicola]
MKIYTKTGDKGETSLIYGKRVPKSDIRVEAYGTCDEANSQIGLALSYVSNTRFEGKENWDAIFHKIQTWLFHIGAELATPHGKNVSWKVEPSHIKEMETQIDVWEKQLEPLKNFILPGGNPAGASLHVARTIVRRAERHAILVEEVNPLVLSFLNRLSDFLFVAARYINYHMGEKESVLHQEN